VPDGDSTLYTEVAAKTAEMFNQGGFYGIYHGYIRYSNVDALNL
jgi:hypothetical protein